MIFFLLILVTSAGVYSVSDGCRRNGRIEERRERIEEVQLQNHLRGPDLSSNTISAAPSGGACTADAVSYCFVHRLSPLLVLHHVTPFYLFSSMLHFLLKKAPYILII